MQFLIKTIISALIIVAVAEVAKRHTAMAALLASLPLTSILAFVWLYRDTKDARQVAVLAGDILWLVIPSLVLFIALPLLIRKGMPFYPALAISMVLTSLAYLAGMYLMGKAA